MSKIKRTINIQKFEKWKKRLVGSKIPIDIIRVTSQAFFIRDITIKNFKLKNYAEFLFDLDINIIVLVFLDEKTKDSYKVCRKHHTTATINVKGLIRHLKIKKGYYKLFSYNEYLCFKYEKEMVNKD